MLTFFIYLAIATALALYIKWRMSRSRLYELAENIPGKPCIPLLGNALEIIGRNNNNIFDYVYKESYKPEFKDVGKIWLAHRLLLAILNPKDIELVLGSHTHLKKAIEYEFFKPWFGNGLLISKGDIWKTHRKMIAPTFHLNVLKRFMNDFNKNSKCVINRMENENGNTFDCHDYMSECMVETLLGNCNKIKPKIYIDPLETVMGVKQVSTGRNCLQYAVSVMKMCDIIFKRQTRIWLRSESIFRVSKLFKRYEHHMKVIFTLTDKVLKQKKEDYHLNKFSKPLNDEEIKSSEEKSNDEFSYGGNAGLKDDIDDDDLGEKKRLPFLESLIENSINGVGMTDAEIKDQVNTIMFEGHDTTAAASSFFLCVMGARPDIQEKCVKEIYSIFGDSDRDITFADTVQMKYMERCIMETLRLFPPVPIVARALDHDVQLASRPDITLPAGCTVIIGIFKLHRRPDIYENPEEFNPDNFLPEKSAARHFYSFIPFSAGPRSCVGRKYAMLKLKILLANVLRKFRVKGGIPMKDWKFQADIILKRSDGFKIALEPRFSTKL